jgi:capsid portal protein
MAAVVAYYKAGQDIKAAVAELESMLGQQEFQEIKAARMFILRNVAKYQLHKTVGNLHNLANSSRAPKVPREVVMDCCLALKAGYFIEIDVGTRASDPAARTSHRTQQQPKLQQVHMYYRSIQEACSHNPLLALVVRDYGITPKGLLEAMHRVDDQLVRRTVEFKYMLSEEHQQERFETAFTLLRMGRWHMESMYDLLKRVWWVDEATIWLVADGDAHLKVYCDAHDEGVRAVMSSPHLANRAKTKAHYLGIVNAVLGPCFFEFTTGTTDIKRVWLEQGKKYKVGAAWGVHTIWLGLKLGTAAIMSEKYCSVADGLVIVL